MPKRMTEKQLAANRANAKKSRGSRPSLASLSKIEDAKERIGRPALEACLRFWVDVLQCAVKREVVTEDGGVIQADPTIEQRLAASREIANRCGLPPRSEHDVAGMAFPLLVVDAGREGLGWPDAEPSA